MTQVEDSSCEGSMSRRWAEVAMLRRRRKAEENGSAPCRSELEKKRETARLSPYFCKKNFSRNYFCNFFYTTGMLVILKP